jgi:hypothetical protein
MGDTLLKYTFKPGGPRRLVDKDTRVAALTEFESEFRRYVEEQQERLDAEREFLKMVLANQGLGFIRRRSSNELKVKALAYVQQYNLGDFLNDSTEPPGNFLAPSETGMVEQE